MTEPTAFISEDPMVASHSPPELAVSAVNPASLLRMGEDKPSRLAHWLATLGDPDFARWLAGFAPTHFYVGSEFCEHLLPSTNMLKKAVDHARDLNLRIALLTPIASPQVMRALADLLPCLPEGCEVVANDWGVAHFVKEHFPALRLAAGRILCRMLKDPRLGQSNLPAQCDFDPAPLRPMFARLGFCRMEIDVPLSVNSDTFSTLPMHTSVHVPFSCVAKGRMCRIGSLALQGPERFAVGRKCRKECLKISARLERPTASDTFSAYQLGNTIVSRHSREALGFVMSAVEQGRINRLVVPGEAI
ncbi:hypothetical protein [Pseudomonas schmalbachii]|uniref:Uncharacterized protein n=1 Tax=Pseudomonas schmalbachii TaxID=2816993 RepID=A0ABS3TLQ3_9PSED|nr:hypothetical protein [Pseudomonas schmalbachii]MBO3273630.1 hypothetical protein [Pseudomonas schmalbachii]